MLMCNFFFCGTWVLFLLLLLLFIFVKKPAQSYYDCEVFLRGFKSLKLHGR